MSHAPVRSFGKRGAPVASRAPVPARPDPLTTTESGIPLDVLAKSIMGDMHAGNETAAGKAGGVVPWSWSAAFIAGISAASLQAGVVVLQAQTPAPLVPGLGGAIGGAGTAFAPALIGLTLFSSGREAAATIVLARLGLRLAGLTSLIAYAIGGGVAGAISSYVDQALFGGEDALLLDASIGMVAGALYRLLAGTKKA